MHNKLALVIPCKGIGDAILMMIASYQLLKKGYRVTTCHPALKELQEWFPGHFFLDRVPQDLSSFDLVIVESDNSSQLYDYKAKNAVIFYPTYFSTKNPPLSFLDQVFDPNKPMADNIAEATGRLLGTQISKDNGLAPPKSFTHRLYAKRVIIHPTSSTVEKNWHPVRFLKLAEKLKQKGFEPVFALNPNERDAWKNEDIQCPVFPSLEDLAKTIYESGFVIGNDSLIGHLASNLNIPTLIIGNDERRMRLWRPGWLMGEVITPSLLIPNIKHLRLRNKFWKSLISTRRVLSTFQNLFASHK